MTKEEPADWVQNIRSKALLIKEWRAHLPTHRKLAETAFYIRVGTNGYRPISIHHDNPCGRAKRENGTAIGYIAQLERAIVDAQRADQPSSRIKPGMGNSKPEHGVQATLIRHALMNELQLQEILGLTGVFDELLFVTDELPAGSLRADIVALGGKDGTYFPVFIELKAVRSLERVKEQLEQAKLAAIAAGDDFMQLLLNATDKAKSDFTMDAKGIPQLLIVWPEPSVAGKESARVHNARKDGFLFVEYAAQFPTDYKFKMAASTSS